MARKSELNSGAAIRERLFWILNQHWRDYLICAHECTQSAPTRAVHGLRTTIRKMIATLELIEKIEGKTQRRFQKQLRKILNAARSMRDLQIQEKWIGKELKGDSVFLEDFRDVLHSKIKNEKKRVTRKITRKTSPGRLRTQEYRIHGIGVRLLRNPDQSPNQSKDQNHTAHTALIRVDDYIDELRKKTSVARAKDLESVHAVRIALKRVRYAIDALGSTYPMSSETLEQMDAVQKKLGLIQDISVLIESFNRFLRKSKKSRHKTELKQYLQKLQCLLDENVTAFLKSRELAIENILEKITDVSAFYLKEEAA